jgi:hypothetical protein
MILIKKILVFALGFASVVLWISAFYQGPLLGFVLFIFGLVCIFLSAALSVCTARP